MTETVDKNAQSYSAEAQWKDYDDFALGIDTNRLPNTNDWAGRTASILFDNEATLILKFNKNTVSWKHGNEWGTDQYEEVCTSEHYYFFDIQFAHKPNLSLSIILNEETYQVLAVFSEIVAEGELEKVSRLKQTFLVGILQGDNRIYHATGFIPALSRELIGYRTLNIYSPNHYYEHFYVNSERYAWQNLKGVQFGQGDMDYATCYKFADNKYVFTFREKIIPVCSVFFFDYELGRCTGKFLGITKKGLPMVTRAGALIYKMSYNCYPTGVAPL